MPSIKKKKITCIGVKISYYESCTTGNSVSARDTQSVTAKSNNLNTDWSMLVSKQVMSFSLYCDVMPLLYPRHTKYTIVGYIVFVFSITMLKCVSVCKLFFSMKDSSGTTAPRILKFCTNIWYD